MTTEERVSRLEGAYKHLATKADLADVKAELKAALADVKAELKADIAELKVETVKSIADLRHDLSQVWDMVVVIKADLAETREVMKADLAGIRELLTPRTAAPMGFQGQPQEIP